MDVFEIGHACAAREELANATSALVQAVLEARASSRKVICFTTGVPGAGKTLVGLNTVQRPEIKDFSSFLSANGPLVKVIQEALVRDVVARRKREGRPMTRRQAEIEVQAFVHNDHKHCNDVRASSMLEVAATQFEIQGLELDWIGLCWGEDLTWDGSGWECRRFNEKRWKTIPAGDPRRSYLMNGYRVLLTRARQGTVIYVPQPNMNDSSRLHRELDATANFLIACGAEPAERQRVANHGT